ncbi:hypothetical protein K461DRAFT_51824 [Myriangium duriaei CBS 260.36]|uniref:Uncharacterized protein n=1 Tax=Myriangium duriaei CBS 260.36 TaxID=1168546 RepID=A0A9P4MDA2_9PEZI|nr:hypothetical protein K461DRAFT_51824 [Myriangium duriaei CBS 260.36]
MHGVSAETAIGPPLVKLLEFPRLHDGLTTAVVPILDPLFQRTKPCLKRTSIWQQPSFYVDSYGSRSVITSTQRGSPLTRVLHEVPEGASSPPRCIRRHGYRIGIQPLDQLDDHMVDHQARHCRLGASSALLPDQPQTVTRHVQQVSGMFYPPAHSSPGYETLACSPYGPPLQWLGA